MVMATDFLDVGQEAGMDAGMLHERLVAHVRAVSGEEDSRSSVWGEHSYARPRGPAPGALVRVLLDAPGAPPARLDVLAPPARAPPLPADRYDSGDDDDDDDDDDEWEEQLAAQAPSSAHARLARAAGAALRAFRLERAAGGRSLGRWARREGARAAAQRLRRALAPHWGGAASWLLDALPQRLPPALRRLLGEALRELRRAAPRLAERLPPQPALRPDPLDAVGEARAAAAPGPWLALAPGGCGALDERFARRLGALLHTRLLAGARGAAAPERWCGARAAEARAALGAVLAAAGRRAVVLAGVGAGAALAAWLAAGAAPRVRALLLLAPPLLTPEGARDGPEDILEEVAVPLLAVVGGAGAQAWRGAAGAVAARGGRARRVLLLAGADDALRLPRRLRRRLALPQQALDAAVAEECARWAIDAVDARAGAAGGDAGGAEPGAGALAAADIMRLPIVFADDEPPPDAARLTVTSGGARRAAPLTRVLVAKRARGRPPAPRPALP